MENFSVTILGSSSASPTTRRNTSSQLVNFYHRLYLIDCGEGTQMQLRRNHFKLSKINHIFISHLHGDHFFGLIGLVSSLNLFGRHKNLHIYADPRIQEILEVQLNFSETVLRFKIIYHPLNFENKELIFEDKKLEVYSYPLDHRIPTCGFIFQEKPFLPNIKKQVIKKYSPDIHQINEIRQGNDLFLKDGTHIKNKDLVIPPPAHRSYAYCSDTKFFEKLPDHLRGVELLYAECTFMNQLQQAANDKFHMTTNDVSTLAKEAKVKKLIVGHFSARYKDMTEIQEELLSLFPDAILVNDNETFHVRESL